VFDTKPREKKTQVSVQKKNKQKKDKDSCSADNYFKIRGTLTYGIFLC